MSHIFDKIHKSISDIEYCIGRFQPPLIIITIIMREAWSRLTAAVSPDWPRMTSVRGSGDEGVEGDRACTKHIRGRAMPSWMCLMSRLRCHRGRKAKMRIVTDFVASVSLAKVRNSSLPPVVNVNNRRKWFLFLQEESFGVDHGLRV